MARLLFRRRTLSQFGGVFGGQATSLEKFTEGLVQPYVSWLNRARVPRFPKEFNDPIWGTLILYPLEIVFLDSPLVQRLRRIKQLGVVHWVYPGATHTRLEHSIGVVHQVQSLITAINSHHPEKDEKFIDTSWTKLLRLAALLHDVGHGVMSHVSENAIADSTISEDIRLAFADILDIEAPSLSEIAAYYIIGSPTCRNLLRKTITLTGDRDLLDEPLKKIQRMIIGQPVSDKIPLLHELISGPFDADKLDYMPRDASMSGVPVVTDIPRLVQKVRAVALPQSGLPVEVARHVRQGLNSYIMTGVALSGGRTLDELMLGRTLLFDKIYRHQKCRAIEAMVASLLSQVQPLLSTSEAMLPYALTDDELLTWGPDSLPATTVSRSTSQDKRRMAIAADLSSRLRSRSLFVRAFAFAQNMPLDPYASDTQQRAGIDQLIRETTKRPQRLALCSTIAAEVHRILRTLRLSSPCHLDPSLLAYISIDGPRTSSEVSQIARAYLISSDNNVKRFRDDYAESKGWADAYLLTRDIGYFFAAPEISQFVFAATERIVRERFGVRIPVSMLGYAKQNADDISALKRRLSSRGYYRRSPYDIRPLPERLDRADVLTRIDHIVSNLNGYYGPATPTTSSKSALLNSRRVVDWLRQFEDDALIESALRTLERIRLVGRFEAAAALSDFIRTNPEYRNGFLCRFGGGKDSSAIITYYAQDVVRECALTIGELAEALSSQDAPIVFLDDFIGTGRQAVTIVESWLGEDLSYDLHEDRGAPLSSDMKVLFKRRKLAFIFAAGSDDGAELFRQRLAELHLDAEVHIQIESATLPTAFGSSLYSSAKAEKNLKERCRRLGKALLSDPGRTSTWIKDRVLGYGNHALLVIFPYNTPTQTLTCLWKSGNFGHVMWTPLFPRRSKT